MENKNTDSVEFLTQIVDSKDFIDNPRDAINQWKMKEIQEKLMLVKNSLTPIQQKYINLRSLENFFQYFDELKEEHKPIVEEIMKGYFSILKSKNFTIDKNLSTSITFSHLINMGRFYSADLNFKTKSNFNDVIFWGIPADIILLVLGQLSKIYYIPITTLIIFVYSLYVKKNFETKNKVYSLRY